MSDRLPFEWYKIQGFGIGRLMPDETFRPVAWIPREFQETPLVTKELMAEFRILVAHANIATHLIESMGIMHASLQRVQTMPCTLDQAQLYFKLFENTCGQVLGAAEAVNRQSREPA